MKLSHRSAAALALSALAISLAFPGGAGAAEALSSEDLGLSKTSVFDIPTPRAYDFGAQSPGTSERLPRYFPGAPPNIPHQIAGFVPIKANANACMGCHNRPDLQGQQKVKGIPTPMPASHYTDLRRSPDQVGQQVVGARFICTQCHAPQADAQPLVENTLQ